jgi:glycosyltransferase involved in cell wall biosynthesis
MTVERVVHVTRLPPSPSGVAAYADAFGAVLAALAAPDRVAVEPLPADPAASQSAALAVRLTRRLLRRPADEVVLVEQAGRGLAEFWAAWWLARRGRRVWLMVHDVPELSGGAFFTRLLDRRGGRRVAAALSASLGRAAERDLLRRAEKVLCLSPDGARALERVHRLDRTVQDVPHVAAPADVRIPVVDRREVLVPGYVAEAGDVLPLVRAAAGWPAGWTLAVGACSAQTEQQIRDAADDRVRLLGFTDEAGVRAAFARAAVVARWRQDGWGAGGSPTARYAVSGPLIAAMAHGCAIVTDDTRGAVHLFGEAGVRTVGEGAVGAAELVAAVGALIADPADLARRGAAGRALALRRLSPEAIAALLDDAPVPRAAGPADLEPVGSTLRPGATPGKDD